MLKRPAAVTLLVLILVNGLAVCGQETQRPLRGVWKVTEVRTTRPNNSRSISSPQPGLYIFTDKYYSWTEAEGDQPRPNLPFADEARASAEQFRAAWGPFIANAGTYELTGDQLTTRVIVSKSQGVMKEGNFRRFSVVTRGDTLRLTTTATDEGPMQYPTTYVLSRVE